MEILHLSFSDLDGGAARGAFWLHKALLASGTKSRMLVARKRSDDPTVIGPSSNFDKVVNVLKPKLDDISLNLYKNRDKYIFSPNLVPSTLPSKIQKIAPDIINIHWVGHSFLNPGSLTRIRKPIVWTLRDMWPLTGGCHYAGNCNRYQVGCGSCPHLRSDSPIDLSRLAFLSKERAYRQANIVVVALSKWIAQCAAESPLLGDRRIEVIPNALDENKFRPIPKNIAREVLGLPQDKSLILFGALSALSDKRKGFEFLLPAIQELSRNGLGETSELLIFGSSRPQHTPPFGMKASYLGRIDDDLLLALVYSASDVTVVPSVEESFGKTAMESMACGTPVVSFDSTGLRDIVDHEHNGYRARCFDPGDLAHGIAWVLQDAARWSTLSLNSREKVMREFTFKLQAQRYNSLYRDILETKQ